MPSDLPPEMVEQAAPWVSGWPVNRWETLSPYTQGLARDNARAALTAAGVEKLLSEIAALAAAAQRFMDAADLRLIEGNTTSYHDALPYFDVYHDARHDLYQALAALPVSDNRA